MLGHCAHLALRSPRRDDHEIGESRFFCQADDDRLDGLVVVQRSLDQAAERLSLGGRLSFAPCYGPELLFLVAPRSTMLNGA
jgi:hypothetical protein